MNPPGRASLAIQIRDSRHQHTRLPPHATEVGTRKEYRSGHQQHYESAVHAPTAAMTFSSQAGPALPFTISSVQQPFRLLELPPELLELLTSPNPPKYVNAPNVQSL